MSVKNITTLLLLIFSLSAIGQAKKFIRQANRANDLNEKVELYRT